MPKIYFKPPLDLIKAWPEVFDDLYMNTLPVSYLESLTLEFKNGRVWEIDIEQHSINNNTQMITDQVVKAFYEYQEEITKINFRIDIDRLKKDIKKSTKKIL